MKELRVETWDEFKAKIAEFRALYGFRPSLMLKDGVEVKQKNPLLFRGQSNCNWSLETTLDRAAKRVFAVQEYMHLARICLNEIETFSGQRWDSKEFEEAAAKKDTGDFLGLTIPAYSYLTYLRHHGFPSPLLDWSESPFVAAFFAYESAREQCDAVVYCFCERPEGAKGGFIGEPMIDLRGPLVTTDRRHFSQRAWYTVAFRWDEKKERRFFAKHDDVFAMNKTDQDVLWKVVLPRKLRIEVLQELADYNINYFTLFHTEDALVRSMGMRHFVVEGGDV